MHTPLTQQSWSGLSVLSREPIAWEPITNVSGKEAHTQLIRDWPQSSQLAEPLWADPGLNSGIRVCELISTLKKKKAQAGNASLKFSPKSSQQGKAAIHHSVCSLSYDLVDVTRNSLQVLSLVYYEDMMNAYNANFTLALR